MQSTEPEAMPPGPPKTAIAFDWGSQRSIFAIAVLYTPDSKKDKEARGKNVFKIQIISNNFEG